MRNLRKYFNFEPTEEQIFSLDSLIKYIESPFDPSCRVFVFKGHAGTGKTTLINSLLNYFYEYNKNFDEKSHEKKHFVLLASTGRAAKVLSEKTRTRVFTIHRQIYSFVPEENRDDEYKIRFELQLNNKSLNTVFIVDESSMIGNIKHSETYLQFGTGKTLSDLLVYTAKHKTIFVGDSAQLPPVNEKISVALSSIAINEYFKINAVESKMQKVMRFNEGSSIYINSQIVLKAIINNKFPEKYEPNCNGDDLSVYDSIEKMVEKYVECFNRDKDDVSNCIFVVSTNRLASEINTLIRLKIFNKLSFLNKGEFLMVSKNNYKYDLMNGDTIKVLNVATSSIKAPGLDSLHFREITAGIGIEPYYYKFTTLIIEESLKSTESSMGIDEEKVLLQNFMIRMKNQKISLKSNDFVKQLMSDPFLNALRVKYGYAVTGHKSQGGEWKDVFIVFQKMLFADEDKSNCYRWIYTTLTRASERLHILRDIGYVGKPDIKNFKMGTFLEQKFTGEVLVERQYLWKSSKGTPMCTLATPTENLVFPQFKIKFNALQSPIFPAYAVFEYGNLILWKK